MSFPSRLERVHSPQLGRPIHLWSHGWYGTPVLVLPSASGMAHEWQLGGAIEALAPWLSAGVLKLYCTESNVSQSWLAEDLPPAQRLARHAAFEAYLTDTLLPRIQEDCRTPGHPLVVCGVSFGGYLAMNLALRHPEHFPRVLTLSGRFRVWPYLEGLPSHLGPDAWLHQPLAYVPGLRGPPLRRVQDHLEATLVVGRGAYEGRCIPETLQMGQALRERGIHTTVDVWGQDVSHEWVWWRRQLVHHLVRITRSPLPIAA